MDGKTLMDTYFRKNAIRLSDILHGNCYALGLPLSIRYLEGFDEKEAIAKGCQYCAFISLFEWQINLSIKLIMAKMASLAVELIVIL